MKPPAYEWAAWAYRAAMAVISTYAMAMLTWVAWQVMSLATSASGPQLKPVLELIGHLLLGLLGLLWLQQIGLVARNLVRNLKISGPAGTGIDVSGHDSAGPTP